jgi:parallel beta-helix repeat protein
MTSRYVISWLIAGCTTTAVAASAHGGTLVAGTLDLTTSINQGVTPTIDTCTAAGWARDPNDTGATRVDFYANAPFGQPGSMFVGATMANLFRADLPFADKNHGFSFTFPINFPLDPGTYPGWNSMADGRTYNLYAYGIALSSSSSTALLQGTPKPIKCVANVKHSTFGPLGSVGTGQGDDSSRIQSAINSSGANSLIYLPSGTYLLGTSHRNGIDLGAYSQDPGCSSVGGTHVETALVLSNPNVRLVGEVSGSTWPVLKLMPQTKLRILSVAPNASRAGAANLVFDGNKANRLSTPNVGWPCGYVVDTLIINWLNASASYSNIESRNGIEDGLGCWHCSSLKITASSFHDNGTLYAGGSGVSITGPDADVSTSTMIGNTGPGVWINGDPGSPGSVANISITHDTIQNNLGAGISVGSDTSASAPDHITISSNTLIGNAAGVGSGPFAAIWVANANNGTISGNIITDNTNGIKIDGASTSWNISGGNNVSSTTAQHLQGTGIWIHGGQVSAIQVTGNTVQRNGGSLSDQIIIDATVPSGAVNADWSTSNTIGWW